MLENPWLKEADKYYGDQPEVFETEKRKFFSTDEENVRSFDESFELAELDARVYESICDDLDEYADYLADELYLVESEIQAIEYAEQLYRDQKKQAAEEKAEYEMESRRCK